MILVIIFFVAVLIYAIFFITQFYNIIFKDYAPTLSTDRITIKKIINELKLKDKTVVYELGCGQAKFLRFIEKNYSPAKLIGVENSLIVYWFNQLKFKLQASKIKLLPKDIFDINLGQADVIYCWLFNSNMIKLGEKIKKECKPGTQIISRSFSIPQFKSIKTLIIENKKVYFYQI